MVAAGMKTEITAATFAAHLKCSTKSYLIMHGEKPPDISFAEMHARISVAYKAAANRHLRSKLRGIATVDFMRLAAKSAPDAATLFVDCETAFYVCDHSADASRGLGTYESELQSDIVPIHYSAWDKSDQSAELLVCFGAVAIKQITASSMSENGKVVYAEDYRIKTVRIADHLPTTR
jgi:hypothetical protein